MNFRYLVFLVALTFALFIQPSITLSSPLRHWLGDTLKSIGHYEEDFLQRAALQSTKDAFGLWSGCMRVHRTLPPRSSRAALLMAYCKMKIGIFEQAMPFVSKAVLRAQNDIAPLLLRASYFERKGILNGLVTTLERCVRLAPADAKLRHRLVMTYAKRRRPGDRNKAFLHAKAVTEVESKYALVYVKVFRRGFEQRYMLDKVAEYKVNQSIGQLRAQRPTMAPRHFKKSVQKSAPKSSSKAPSATKPSATKASTPAPKNNASSSLAAKK